MKVIASLAYPHRVERKVRIMVNSERDLPGGLIVLIVTLLLIFATVVVVGMTRDSNCMSWYENTGGDFRLTNWGCEVRINEDTYVPWHKLPQHYNELDLSYVE